MLQQPKEPTKKQLNAYLRYSTMVFQMIAIIGIGTWLGKQADSYYTFQKPWLTLIAAISSVAVALYVALKGLPKS
jgi:ATP synthase protein I